MAKRALITGITGQDGRYLSEFLANKNYQVFGLLHGQNNPKSKLVQAENPRLEPATLAWQRKLSNYGSQPIQRTIVNPR